jgi:hypothetical protein
MIIRWGDAAAARRLSSYRIRTTAATREHRPGSAMWRSGDLSHFAKIVLVFAAAIGNI